MAPSEEAERLLAEAKKNYEDKAAREAREARARLQDGFARIAAQQAAGARFGKW